MELTHFIGVNAGISMWQGGMDGWVDYKGMWMAFGHICDD